MSSNEHPDMHGNPSDAPIICDNCGKQCQEEECFGIPCDDQHFFCSADCAEAYEESQRFDHDL